MQLQLNKNHSLTYKGGSQISRVITEAWAKENCYCPNCGADDLNQYANNMPVADFHCKNCTEEYELKSKSGVLGKKIVDGAFSTMIARIGSNNNPNFFFLTYSKNNWEVSDFLIIPKQFFTNEIIEKRKPLAITARRAGWVGCNINIEKIPSIGRVSLISKGIVQDKKLVLSQFQKTLFLRANSVETKGWLIDIMQCLDNIKQDSFTLDNMYAFEAILKAKHPHNQHIKDKIRQQLQLLRDKRIIEFTSRGNYKKIKHGYI